MRCTGVPRTLTWGGRVLPPPDGMNQLTLLTASCPMHSCPLRSLAAAASLRTVSGLARLRDLPAPRLALPTAALPAHRPAPISTAVSQAPYAHHDGPCAESAAACVELLTEAGGRGKQYADPIFKSKAQLAGSQLVRQQR